MTRSCLLLLLTLPLAAQQSGAQPGTQPIQLPLSGRGGSNASVSAVQTPTPGVTTSVNTLNNTVQTQGSFGGSVKGKRPFSGQLGLRDAIARGLDYNLGAVNFGQMVRQARGQQQVSRAALLPNVNSSLREVVQQTNLKALGINVKVPVPGFSFPYRCRTVQLFRSSRHAHAIRGRPYGDQQLPSSQRRHSRRFPLS